MLRNMRTWILMSGAVLLLTGSAPAADSPAPDSQTAALIKAASSGKESARIQAIGDLGAQAERSAEAVGALGQLLTDKSAKIRARAAWRSSRLALRQSRPSALW